MKKILFFLLFISLKMFGQINTLSGTDGSVTITPKGLQSKFTKGNNSSNNIGLGSNALGNNLFGTGIIAIGENAHFSIGGNSSNYQVNNIAIGAGALYRTQPSTFSSGFATNGYGNIAIGRYALYDNVIGNYNTAIGNGALEYNTEGPNTAVGFNSLGANTTGTNNNAFGYFSLKNNDKGFSNVAYGAYSLYQNTNASRNTALGNYALSSQNFVNGGNTFNSDNVAVGFNSLYFNNPTTTTNGILNTAVGSNALYYNRTGLRNVAVGAKTMYNNSYSSKNVAIGTDALGTQSFANGNVEFDSHNVAIGNNALYSNNPTSTTNGIRNTAIGSNAMFDNEVGLRNTAVGAFSLENNTYASKNVAIGDNALNLQSFANGNAEYETYNVAIGNDALAANQPTSIFNAYQNVAIGGLSMQKNKTGYSNTAIGHSSLNQNTTGYYNTSIGFRSMNINTQGKENVAVGDYALQSNINGNRNVAIGNEAGSFETGDEKLYIENSPTSTPLIGGDFATNVVGINMPITSLASNITWKLQVGGDINATGSVRAAGVMLTSDVRFKKNIQSIENPLQNLLKLNAFSYDWRVEEFPARNFNNKKQMGLLAQEVEKIFPALVDTDAEGYKSVNYLQLTPLMIEAIKELKHENESMKKRIGELEELKSEMANLKAIILTEKNVIKASEKK